MVAVLQAASLVLSTEKIFTVPLRSSLYGHPITVILSVHQAFAFDLTRFPRLQFTEDMDLIELE